MDPLDEMISQYAKALRRHQQHIEDSCERWAWHEIARILIDRAVESAARSDEPRRQAPLIPLDPSWHPGHGLSGHDL